MDKVKAILDGEKEILIDGLFYLYNSKYYLIYTEKEIDENGYVIMHLSQVGKEIKKGENGTVDTGYMVGVEIQDVDDWKNVQKSITTIVDDKKNGNSSPDIKYLPMDMIKKIKILGSKKFRLVKDLLEQHFEITFDSEKIVPEKNEVNTFENQQSDLIKNEVQEVDVNLINNQVNTNERLESNVLPNYLENNRSNIDEQTALEEPLKKVENEMVPNIFSPIKVEEKNDIAESEIAKDINNKETTLQPQEGTVASENSSDDNGALIFKPNIVPENDNIDVSVDDKLEIPKISEDKAESSISPVALSEHTGDEINYEVLYNEMKTNNENLKQKVQELELKLENIKKILG